MKKFFFLFFALFVSLLYLIFSHFHFDIINSYIKQKINKVVNLKNSDDFLLNIVTFNFYTNQAEIEIDQYKIITNGLIINPFSKTIKFSDFKITKKNDQNQDAQKNEAEDRLKLDNINEIILPIFSQLSGYNLILNNGKFLDDKKIQYQEIGFYNHSDLKLKLQGSYRKNSFETLFTFAKSQDGKLSIESINLKNDTLNLTYTNHLDSFKISINGKNLSDLIKILYPNLQDLEQINQLSDNEFAFDYMINKNSKTLDGSGRIMFNNDTNNSISIKSFKTKNEKNLEIVSIVLNSDNINLKRNSTSDKQPENKSKIKIQNLFNFEEIVEYFYGNLPYEILFEAKKILYGEIEIQSPKIDYFQTDKEKIYKNLDLQVVNGVNFNITENAFEILFSSSDQQLLNIIPGNIFNYLKNPSNEKKLKLSGRISSSTSNSEYTDVALSSEDQEEIISVPTINDTEVQILINRKDLSELIDFNLFTELPQDEDGFKNNLEDNLLKMIRKIIDSFEKNSYKISIKESKYNNIDIKNLDINIEKNLNSININTKADSSILKGNLAFSLDKEEESSSFKFDLNANTIDIDQVFDNLKNIQDLKFESFQFLSGVFNIKADTANLEGEKLANIKIDSTMTNGVLQFSKISDKLNINANANFKSSPVLSISSSYNSIPVQKILNKYCKKIEEQFSGTLNGTIQLNSNGSTIREIINNMNGTAHTIIQNAKIKNFSPLDLSQKILHGEISKIDETSIFENPVKSFSNLDGYFRIENKKVNGYLNLDQKITTGNLTYSFDIPSSTILEAKGVFVISGIDLKSKNKDQMNIFVPFAFNGQCNTDDGNSKFESKIDTENIKKYFDYIKKR